MAGKKCATFSIKGIEGLATDKPVVYTILNKEGRNVFTGVAKKGHIDEKIKEHLPGGLDVIYGGARVKIKQKSSIAVAKISEARIIRSQQPRQNLKAEMLCY